MSADWHTASPKRRPARSDFPTTHPGFDPWQSHALCYRSSASSSPSVTSRTTSSRSGAKPTAPPGEATVRCPSRAAPRRCRAPTRSWPWAAAHSSRVVGGRDSGPGRQASRDAEDDTGRYAPPRTRPWGPGGGVPAACRGIDPRRPLPRSVVRDSEPPFFIHRHPVRMNNMIQVNPPEEVSDV